VQSYKVKAWSSSDDAAFMHRLTDLIENWQVDPGKARRIPRAPNDIFYLEGAAVGQQGLAIANADDSRNPVHAGRSQILGLDPYERCRSAKQRGPFSSSDRRA
jgi:hypothetical protein